MSLIQTPWTSQPQQAVGIDWGNPITRGLVDWRSPTCGLSMVSTNGTIKTTRNGVAFSGNGAGVSGWYGVVNSGEINAENPATILALVIGASGNTDARAYSIAASTRYFFQIGSGATTASKLRLVYRSPSRDLIGGETSSVVFENGVPHVAALRYTPGLLESFIDGKADITLADTASGTTSGTLWASTNTLWRGSATTQNNTSVVLGLFWKRALSDAEIRSISQNPWQIFKPLPRRIFVPVAAGGGTTAVTADHNASYTITGSVAADASAAYAIRAAVTADATASYALRAAVAADSAASYALRAAAQADQAAAYAIRAAVASDLAGSYAIQSAGTVTTGLDAAYAVRSSVAGDISVGYQIAAAVQAEVATAYAVRAAVQKDLVAGYAIQAGLSAVSADLIAAYAVDGSTTTRAPSGAGPSIILPGSTRPGSLQTSGRPPNLGGRRH